MRYQGKITNWKDGQGYGFITPNGGGEQVFVHVKAFSNTRRRPAGNEIVTYELTAGEGQRPRAAKVAFVARHPAAATSSGAGRGMSIFAALFFVFLLGAVFTGRLAPAALALYAGASLLAFCAYAFDKSAAQRDRWRIPESTLHLYAIAGGWPGALLAQKMLRHKSIKQPFQTVFRATVMLNCSALLAYLSPTASRAVLSVFS